MKIINAELIAQKVRDAFIEANHVYDPRLLGLIREGAAADPNPRAREILELVCENAAVARELNVPICQDTGMAVVFVELGSQVYIEGSSLAEAVNEGVRRAYTEGYMRLSVAGDPLRRVNTGDNTPAVLHIESVPGDVLRVTCMPKGAGSENMSAVKMMNPSASAADIVEFVIQTVEKAGANACPPMVVGVGIGGNFEHAPYLAKKALAYEAGRRNPDALYAEMEIEIIRRANELGIGPQGMGGGTAVLDAHILAHPTHIASLPVAVNIGCHVNRHVTFVL